ncbi:MAG: 50S ribosomal protein L9, partial [Amylibacter sp.]|nr:50S ribosomal protein L9 [Amylibacter sp.]
LPQGKALRATEANKAAFESQKVTLEAKNLETKTEAEAISAKLGGQQFIIIRSASDAGALYGSVTNRDASDAASAEGFKIDKKQVILQAPIKELGLHKVGVSLHPEVECSIELNVARSSEEAELQASGQSIQDLAAAAEAEAEFEIAELFDDMGSAAALDEDGNELIKDEPKAESEEKVEE